MYQLLSICVIMKVKHVDGAPVLPDYWKGKLGVTLNGSMATAIPAKLQAYVNTYKELTEGVTDEEIEKLREAQNDPDIVELREESRLPSNRLPNNKSGTIHKAVFKKGFITNMEVLDRFNYDVNNSVPVHFSTCWYGIETSKSYNHSNYILSEAMNKNNILNMTWFIDFFEILPEESDKINKDRKFEIDKMFCYYEESSALLFEGKCVIDYKKIIENYKQLWNDVKLKPQAYNGRSYRVTNNATFIKNYECGISDGPEFYKKCKNSSFYEAIHYVPIEEQFIAEDKITYKLQIQPAGIGWATNAKFGLNKTKGAIDFNFTMIFKNWTYDLPDGLLKSYMDSSFNYRNFRLEIAYWVENRKPKPERKVPDLFWFLAIIFIIPAFFLLSAVLLVLLTRSRYAFIDDLWNYLHTDFQKISEEIKLLEMKEREMRAKKRKDNHAKNILSHAKEHFGVAQTFVHY